MPSLSSNPSYLHVFPCSSSCVSLLMSFTKFCEWTSLPLLNAILAHFSSPNSIWISSLKVLTDCICFWSSSSDLGISFKSSTHSMCNIFVFVVCLRILHSTHSDVKWEGLSKCNIAVVIMIFVEKFHVVFLYLLSLLAYFLCVGAYVFSSSSWPSWLKL